MTDTPGVTPSSAPPLPTSSDAENPSTAQNSPLKQADGLIASHQLHPHAHKHLHALSHHVSSAKTNPNPHLMKHFEELSQGEKSAFTGTLDTQTKSRLHASSVETMNTPLAPPPPPKPKEALTTPTKPRRASATSKMFAGFLVLALIVGGAMAGLGLVGSDQDLRQQASRVAPLACMAKDGGEKYIDINPVAPKAGDTVTITCNVSGVDGEANSVRVVGPQNNLVIAEIADDPSQFTFVADRPGQYHICCDDYCLPGAERLPKNDSYQTPDINPNYDQQNAVEGINYEDDAMYFTNDFDESYDYEADVYTNENVYYEE